MGNAWLFGCSAVGLALELDPSRKDRLDFHGCPAVEAGERMWREKADAPFQEVLLHMTEESDVGDVDVDGEEVVW